ncbi:alternative ribosome rescue aminoacyl-tRNA hydrolase ArfB [Alteromonas gracilis]
MGPSLSVDDLIVPPGPGIPRGLVVPAEALTERFSRSSGPGGQSVNTTDSRVELVLEAGDCAALPERARTLGTVRVVVTRHRSQHRNRVEARELIADRVRAACAPPAPKRVPTKPSRGSQRRRMDAKTRRGRVKQLRGRVRD